MIEGLGEEIQKTIRKRGFDKFSQIQKEAIPWVLKGENVIIIAPTGTGKTESAMIPIFQNMLLSKNPGFRVLYVTPLRSLNRDMLGRLQWWCHEIGLSVGVRHGDTTQSERRKQALSPPHLLITTPETIQAMFMGKRLRNHMQNVQCVVIDEIHELAGNKRGAQLAVALERIAEYAGNFQRIGLSATVGNPPEIGKYLCSERPFQVIQVPLEKKMKIDVIYGGDTFDLQAKTLENLIDKLDSTLIFVNTRVTAEALGHKLFERGDVEVHHGSLSKEVRIDAEERFKQGSIKTLICTSSMELGIDIGHVSHVVQFGSPREVSRLIQRVGRSGHTLMETSRGTIISTGFDDLCESLVIVKKALAHQIEDIVIENSAADVIANQVAALLVEYGEENPERIKNIILRASPFKFDSDLIESVIKQMLENRLVRKEGEKIRTTIRARKYLASNLSMIHDEKKVPIFDMISRRTVGTFDESFVISELFTGAVFITKGQLWRVISMDDGRLTVEPARHAKGDLPSWEGEQIPVPFKIAREVGYIRAKQSIEEYTEDKGSLEFFMNFLSRMKLSHSPVPDCGHIVLEYSSDGVLLHICAGHKANETIARVVSTLISARYATTVGIEIDAYRIFLRLPQDIGSDKVLEIIEGTEPDHIETILQIALKRTALYRWKIVQIAKKFGVIDSDADYERISVHRLSELFEGTIIQKEAYRELFSRYMDISSAKQVMSEIKKGTTNLLIAPISLLGTEGFFSSRDMIPPPSEEHAVLATLKRRLEQERIVLACMNCREWRSHTVVSRVPDSPTCPKCNAKLIAAIKPYEEDLFDLVSRKRRPGIDRMAEQKLIRNANIVLSSGKKAVTALAGKGVGPENAARILNTLADGDDFYREILKAERNFIKNHKFW